jgi:hypothetical protein
MVKRMFSRKKPASRSSAGAPAMRGRDSDHQAESTPNPLARRFQADSEPDTIDLDQPGRFHAPEAQPEPETSSADSGPARKPAAGAAARPLHDILSADTATGKFYVHPGGEDLPVLLGGQPVTAVTELRRGDCIQVGGAEFEFLP